ncbi:LPXTG cell wall anchor domain-containing protein [Enterococcus rotai]|uniref:LPXTG cell wall anchor domain-containing protein n=1 Tax=Enterococcus rotai TaxID=118060 RepID=UPI0032B3818D
MNDKILSSLQAGAGSELAYMGSIASVVIGVILLLAGFYLKKKKNQWWILVVLLGVATAFINAVQIFQGS